MRLRASFADELERVQCARPFLPFVGGEAARIECCALAAKRCLGLEPAAAVDPWQAAANVGIVVGGEEFFARLSPADRRQVLDIGGGQWSAGTILAPPEAMVILNPTHDPVRQKATLAEELAHIVMGHPPSRIDPTTGLRTYDGGVENEAYGVGGAMILPYAQLFNFVKRRVSAAAIATRFAVSQAFVNYRINRAGLRRMYRKNTG